MFVNFVFRELRRLVGGVPLTNWDHARDPTAFERVNNEPMKEKLNWHAIFAFRGPPTSAGIKGGRRSPLSAGVTALISDRRFLLPAVLVL
ncbi:hypothetical protein PO909_027870 [Leuciscus waleckii]